MDRQHKVLPTHQLFQIPSPVWLVSDRHQNPRYFPEFCEKISLKTELNQAYLLALMQKLAPN